MNSRQKEDRLAAYETIRKTTGNHIKLLMPTSMLNGWQQGTAGC